MMKHGSRSKTLKQNRSPSWFTNSQKVMDTNTGWKNHGQGILVMDYMPHKTTLTGIVCAAVPQNLKEAIMKNDDRRLQRVPHFFLTMLLYARHEKQQP
jgi:hypothetical protein